MSTVFGDYNIGECVLLKYDKLDLSSFKDKSIIIKGCSKKSIPKSSYSFLIDRLQPIAKKIMFGEACASVPIFKKSLT